MKATSGFLVTGMVLWLGACASAPPAEAPQAAAPAAPAAKATETARLDPNETVCRRQATTGSRFASTRCQTRYQWELEQREARKQTQEHQGSSTPPQT